MLVTVALRYGSIAVQFTVLMILARHLSLDDYGRYMLVLGIVWSAYTLLGLGASETFVREAPKHLQHGRSKDVAVLAGGTLLLALGSAGVVGVLGWVSIEILALDPTTKTLVLFALAFGVANGLVFNAAQMLLGAGYLSLGSFFYYPAVNLGLFASSVPYVLIAENPTFQGVAIVTSGAGLLIAGFATLLVIFRLRPTWPTVEAIRQLVTVGIRLSFARSLGYIGVWLPIFLAGVLLAPAQAGYLGTASRLAFAVGAVTAAVRFAVRPAIVRAFDVGDRASIKETCGKLASATFALALLALAVSLVAGESIFRTAFGADFAPAAPLLTILLIGIAFEAFVGPVDEVLKMTGHENRVSAILIVTVACSVLAIFIVAPMGVSAFAWVQVFYTVALFSGMLVITRMKLGIWLHPVIRRSTDGKSDLATLLGRNSDR